jgi:hypothetical protein
VSFLAFLRKNRVKAVLLVLVIVETSAITGVEALAWSHYAEYGNVQYGCSTLVGSNASNPATVNITNVHWMVFGCPNGPAVKVAPGPLTCFFCAHEPPYASITPTFTPPLGIVGIFAVSDPQWDCPGQNPTIPFNRIPLVSGRSLIYFDHDIDYCVVLNSSVKTISPFSIEWSTGPPQGSYTMPSVMLFAPNATALQGQNATFALTLSSQHGFAGNVTLTGGISQLYQNKTFFADILFKSRSLILKPGSFNSTTVIVWPASSQAPGTYTLEFYADPVYNLSFYGDYAGSATRTGGSTTIQFTIT